MLMLTDLTVQDENTVFINTYMLLAGWEVRLGKNCSRLRWLKTVSSTFQDLDFDVSL